MQGGGGGGGGTKIPEQNKKNFHHTHIHAHILDNLTFADRLRPRPLTIEETLSNFIPFQPEPFIAVIHSLSTDSTPRLFDASITRSL